MHCRAWDKELKSAGRQPWRWRTLASLKNPPPQEKMPHSRSCSRWLICATVVMLFMVNAQAEDAPSGETPHPIVPPAGVILESLTPAPPTILKEGETSSPATSPTVNPPPPVPPNPATTAPPIGSLPPPGVTAVPTEGNAALRTNRPAAPTMASNTTTPSDPPPTTPPPPPAIPVTEAPNASSETLPAATPSADLPNPTMSNDTIHYVPTPTTTVPVPSDSSTASTSRESSFVPFSAVGGALLLVIVVLIAFLIFRRRESKVKRREGRTLAMSEMFLSSTSHREATAPAQVLEVDISDDACVDSAVSHEVEDDASSQGSIPPSPESVQSDPSDSYRSSYNDGASNSLSGFFSEPPLSGSSARSSTFYGHDSVVYDSDADL